MELRWRLEGTDPFSAVVFDMNGVIIDDVPYHKQAFFELCKAHEIELTEKRFDEKINARTNREIFEFLYDRTLSDKEVEEFASVKEARYRDLYAPHRRLLPGVTDFLARLKAAGVRTAIATSAPPENIPFILDHFNLYQYLDAIIDATSVVRGKPDPSIYLAAAKALGVEPRDCLVFEDALLGVQAALGAGMEVMGVATTHDELPGVKAMIHDFGGLVPLRI